MTNAIVAWLLSMMVQLAPPERLAAAPQLKGWEETAEQKQERYEQIANALYEVVYDSKTNPIFGGKDGRANTAALLLSISFFESGFAHDVDKGPCYKGPKGSPFAHRCDGGRATCLAQIRLDGGVTNVRTHGVDGWTQNDLFSDRRKCFTVALHMVRKSFLACRRFGPDWALNVYSSGTCFRNTLDLRQRIPTGITEGRARLQLARRLLERNRVPDADVNFMIVGESSRDVVTGVRSDG